MSFLHTKTKGEKMQQNKFKQGLNTNSSVIDEIRSIYQRLGIPVNGLSKELEEILDMCQAYNPKVVA